MRRFLPLLLSLLFCLSVTGVHAEGPAFDLAGPKVDVHVKRGAVTLPISEVPNLLPGDRLWVHPDLPKTQSEHFVLVVAFLRGSTNPPPPKWFTRVETWTRAAHDEGVFVTVPAEAQQALLFLAPETGGDFSTLRKSVREQPGSFVRAAQDLQAASFERMRLENYLSDIKITSQTNPKALKIRAELAARSLGIKINEDCFSRPLEQQVSCLSHNSEGMVLDDANAQSLVNQLTAGSTLDLVNQLTVTAGGGIYSPYVGAIVDTARILSSLHTAHFQYIPALALPTTDSLNLRLNIPPSFRNPKSVVVVGLPPIGPTRAEPLYAVSPAESYCATKPGLVLSAEGAPLMFATAMAHNLVLHIAAPSTKDAAGIDVPVVANPSKGGMVFTDAVPALPAGVLTGRLRGKWGFDDWEGPTFQLYAPGPGKWAVASGDESALVVGRDDTLHLLGENTQCVQRIEEQTATGLPLSLPWSPGKSGALEITIPLKDAQPGPVNLNIYQYGMAKPDQLTMVAYESAASLQGLTLNAGDSNALLRGTRLDQVARAKLRGIVLTPATLSRAEDLDQLVLQAATSTAGLDPEKSYTAEVELKDGRRLKAPVTVEPPRPRIALLSKGVQDGVSGAPSPVQMGSPDDLPVDGRLVFFIKSIAPAVFPRDQKVELAAADSSFHTMLNLSDGSLLLADSTTAEGIVQPLTRFGFSAFGPVRVRAVAGNGQSGDWVPLGTLVRIPGFKELRCPRAAAKPCVLTGTDLFLATSVAATPQFDDATDVPPEFTGTQLIVPHPAANGQLYLKLRDDPATVQTLTLPVTTITPAEARTALPLPPAGTPIPTPAPSSTAEPEPASSEPSTPPVSSPDSSQPPTAALEPSTPPAAATSAKPAPGAPAATLFRAGPEFAPAPTAKPDATAPETAKPDQLRSAQPVSGETSQRGNRHAYAQGSSGRNSLLTIPT